MLFTWWGIALLVPLKPLFLGGGGARSPDISSVLWSLLCFHGNLSIKTWWSHVQSTTHFLQNDTQTGALRWRILHYTTHINRYFMWFTVWLKEVWSTKTCEICRACCKISIISSSRPIALLKGKVGQVSIQFQFYFAIKQQVHTAFKRH